MKLVIPFAIALAAMPAYATPPPAPVTLTAVERAVLSSHPAVRAALARWQAARARVPQAAAWEDPMMSLSLEKAPDAGDGVADAVVTLSQKLPVSGLPKAQSRVAELEAARAYDDIRRTRAALVMRARLAFIAYASANERIALNEQHLRILNDITTVTQRKIETAEAMVGDALQAQTEAAMLSDKRVDLEREAETARIELNSLMQRPVTAPLPAPAPLRFESLPQNSSAMITAALAHRPELRIAAQQVSVDTGQIDVARRQRRPDPSLVVGTRQMNGSDAGVREVDFGLSFPLTFVNHRKYDAAVREAEAARQASASDFEALRLETINIVSAKFAEAKAAAGRYLIVRDQVVPQARRALEARAAEFSARKATFLEYNTARVLLQNAQTELFDRLAAYVSLRAELQTLTEWHPVPDESPNPARAATNP